VITISLQMKPSAEKVALGLVEWGHVIDDFRDAFADIRHVFNRHQTRHFDSGGRSTGDPWPTNWTPKVPWLGRQLYPVFKAAAVGHPRPLEFSGRLRAAATGGAGSLRRTTKTSMELGVGSGVPYAEDHHLGRAVSSALFGRTIQLKKRAVVRFNGSPLGTKATAFDSRGRASFGYATRQLIGAHAVRARKIATGFPTSAADATIRRIRNTETR